MHPVIGECIYNILYHGKKAPTTALRQKIKRYEAEIVAVAVVSVLLHPLSHLTLLIPFQVRGALDNYTTGTFLSPEFNEARYRPLYDRTLSLIDQALNHEDHGTKMRAQWAEWMQEHSLRGGKKNPTVATAEDMDISL